MSESPNYHKHAGDSVSLVPVYSGKHVELHCLFIDRNLETQERQMQRGREGIFGMSRRESIFGYCRGFYRTTEALFIQHIGEDYPYSDLQHVLRLLVLTC